MQQRVKKTGGTIEETADAVRPGGTAGQPGDPDAWVHLGSVLQSQGRHGEALGAYDRALGLAPDDPMIWSARGSVLASLGDYPRAAAAYGRARALGADTAGLQRQMLAYAGDLLGCERVRRSLSTYDALGRLHERRAPLRSGQLIARYFSGRHSDPELLHAAVDSLLASAVALESGDGFDSGHTLKLPFSELTVRAQGGARVLCEPDWQRGAMHATRPEVSFTAQHLVLSSLLHDLVGAEIVPTDYRSTIDIDPRSLHAARVTMHRRAEASDDDCGWVVFTSDDATLVSVPIAWVVTHRPHLSKVLTLPTGYRVLLDGARVVRVADQDGDVRFRDAR